MNLLLTRIISATAFIFLICIAPYAANALVRLGVSGLPVTLSFVGIIIAAGAIGALGMAVG